MQNIRVVGMSTNSDDGCNTKGDKDGESVDEDIIKAHKFSINHRSAILKDKKCGCFYCMKIFSPQEITEWIKDKIDGTAICPMCGIDSVIGESSGFPITREFLLKMNEYWFNV